jgi:hypothetical protein
MAVWPSPVLIIVVVNAGPYRIVILEEFGRDGLRVWFQRNQDRGSLYEVDRRIMTKNSLGNNAEKVGWGQLCQRTPWPISVGFWKR